jgi:ATP-dependent protease ClpP protease subunit
MKQHAIKRMFAAKKQASVLELFIYSEIGEDWFGEGITPQSVTDSIKAAKADGGFDSIAVHLNSPGGSAFDGVAIHNVLRQQKVPVNVIVEGLAASAAFTIAMAGDTIQVCDGAMMMLHNAWSIAMGDATDMRSMADTLDKVSGSMRDVYSKRSGLAAGDVEALMSAETWLSPQDAVEKGFADSVMSTTPEKSKEASALVSQFNLAKMFQHVPDSLKASSTACQCPCSECAHGDCAGCSHDGCDCVGCQCDEAEEAQASADKKKTKRVDGEDLTIGDFAYQGDPKKTAEWKLPIKFSTDEKTKTHIRNAIARFDQTDMSDKAEKDKAWDRIKAAAKQYDIEISKDATSQAKSGIQSAAVDPDDDGDDDSAIVAALNSAASACEAFADTLSTAADDYTSESLKAVIADSEDVTVKVKEAVNGAHKELSEGDDAQSSAIRERTLRLKELTQPVA